MWGRLSPCAWCGSGGSVCSPSWRPGWCQHPWVGTVCSWSHVNSLWHLLSHRSTTYPTNWCYWGCYLISQDNRWWNVLGSHRQGSTSWCSIATGDPLRRYSMLISVKVVVHSLFTSVLSCHSSAGCTLLLISQKFPTHSYPSRMCQSRRYRTRKSLLRSARSRGFPCPAYDLIIQFSFDVCEQLRPAALSKSPSTSTTIPLISASISRGSWDATSEATNLNLPRLRTPDVWLWKRSIFDSRDNY